MVLVGVVQVGQGREVGEHTGSLVVSVVLLQGLHGAVPVVHVGVLGHVVVAVKALVVARILIELGAVRVGHAHGHEGGSRHLTGLGDLGDDVVAVEQQRDGAADLSLSLRSLHAGQLGVGGQNVFVDVPADVVGADLARHHKLGGILLLQGSDLRGGHVVDQLPVAVLEVRQHVVCIIGQIEVDLVHGDGVRGEVGGVLGQGDLAVVVPAGHGVRAVGHIGGGIGSPGFVGDHVLTDREERREGQQFIPVRQRVVQGHDQGLIVGGFHSQLVRIALHALKHVAVVRTQRGRSRTLPGELKVLGGQRRTIGPGEAVLQGVGIRHGAVFVGNRLRQLGRALGIDLQLAFRVLRPGRQTGEQVRGHGRAVNSGVEGGIQGVRLGGQAHRHARLGFFSRRSHRAGERHDQRHHESNQFLHRNSSLFRMCVSKMRFPHS